MMLRRIPRFLLKTLLILAASAAPTRTPAVPRLPEPELSWKNVTVGDRKTAVFCLFRDRQGIMWAGTNSGLYFYDGVTTHPAGDNELFGMQIYAIVEKEGRLFLGSNNGLLVYDYATGRIGYSEYVTPQEIRTLLLVDDQLWIGGLNGICRLDLKSGRIEECSDGLPHRSVYAILRDARGIIYVGTYNGPARWEAAAQRFKPLKVRIGAVEQPALFANCLLESDDGEHIYVGGEGFLYKYAPADERWERIRTVGNNNIKSLARGEAGHILAGTDDGVFDLSDEGAKHYRHDSRQELSLADNEIWCIYADPQHNIWTGHERGFSIASNSHTMRTVKLAAFTRSGEGNEVHLIRRDSRGDLWLAGTNGVIRLSDDATPHWYRHSEAPGSLSHNRVRDILETDDGTVWFATDAGINRFDARNERFDVFHVVDPTGRYDSNWVYALVEDGGYFWVGSFLNGLHYVDKAKFGRTGGVVVSDRTLNAAGSPEGAALANDLVNDVVRDRRGDLWILLFRDSELIRYTPSSGRIRTYDIFRLAGAYPTAIRMDRRGRVWCAYKGGVALFDPEDDSCRTVHFPHTGSDETILAMGSVAEGMWISTQSNVWSIDGDAADALLLPIPQKSYTAVFEDPANGKVYLGGTDEILEVDSGIVGHQVDYRAIRMILNDRGEGLYDLSDIRGCTEGLTIPYGGGITLVVSTLDYAPESVQRYMYRLARSPADTLGEWVVLPEGSNSITFSDLKMGDYDVLVRTAGSPALPVAVPLTVRPPLALRWWAILLYVLLAAGTVGWTVWYMRRKNLRAFREQERQAALEHVERKLQFLATISHDLKTPLSMILGPVSLMKERTRDPESRRTLESVYDNAVRLNNMIHRTIELQQMEDTGENLLIRSTFDVVEFCRSVFDVFRDNNPQKNFVFHTSAPRLRIEADAVKFESVVTNLLSNACKYSDVGATISCGISRQGDRVEIVVSDDGVGIAESDQQLVFQRMFRAPSTAKLREGTGLGLYLIKKYLELMDGNIDLYSREGQGTSFIVTLPICDEAAPEAPAGEAPAGGGEAKILVVEDNLQISGFITELLKEEYTLLAAENGRSGLAIAASFLPDLIIADEMMPIMNGLEMVRRMKQHPRLASVPIIMLTAKSDNKTENESIKLGIDAFMTKPFEPSALVGRISQLLKARTEIREKVRIQAIAEAEARPIEAETVNEKALARIAKVIEENISDPDLNVGRLSDLSGIPGKQLYRLIRKYMGLAPLDYIRRVRLQKAAVLLGQHRFTVAEISYMVGFKTPSYFAKCFQNQYGVKPSQYRSGDEAPGKE